MQAEDLIPAAEFCAGHRIEIGFVRTLHESGLIHLQLIEGDAYLAADELEELEKYVRWHYELAINPAGIEALTHVLERVRIMQEEMQRLRNRLQRFENGEQDAFSEGD